MDNAKYDFTTENFKIQAYCRIISTVYHDIVQYIVSIQ